MRSNKTPRRRARAAARATLPFVSVNVAMTADGKIATANRRVSSFSSPRDKEHLLELRARADAVLSGARTVDLNEVFLDPGSEKYRRRRRRRGLAEYNLRVVASRRGTLDPGAAIFTRPNSPVIVLTTERARRRLPALRRAGAEPAIFGKIEVDFRRALAWLRARHGVKHLLCEGGGEINEALFTAGLVDELHLTICPKIMGGRGAPTLADGAGFPSLASASRWRWVRSRRVADELFLVFRKHPGGGAHAAGRLSARRARSQSKSERRLR